MHGVLHGTGGDVSHADGHAGAHRPERRGSGQLQPVPHVQRGGSGRPREQHRELVAAEAEHTVEGSHRCQQHLGQSGQHAVAFEVAVRVVDALEVIDVEQSERSLDAVALPRVQRFEERGAVAHSREHVLGGAPAQLVDVLDGLHAPGCVGGQQLEELDHIGVELLAPGRGHSEQRHRRVCRPDRYDHQRPHARLPSSLPDLNGCEWATYDAGSRRSGLYDHGSSLEFGR